MKAIILAAGAGRRLGLPYPKTMIDIAGTTIIRRQLMALRHGGIESFVIVVGFRQDQLRAHLAGESGTFHFIENPRFTGTNTIYSLYLAREHMGEGFLFANADVLFDHRLIDRLGIGGDISSLAFRRMRCGDEEVKVVIHDDRVARIGKRLDPGEACGEFLGVAWFSAAQGAALASSLVDIVEREDTADAYFERAVDRLVPECPIRAVDVTDLPCCEIDFPADLDHARCEIAPRLPR